MITISTPDLAPPVKLTGMDEATVVKWANDVRDCGERKNILYTREAICYYVREFYSIHSPEYRVVCSYITEERRQERQPQKPVFVVPDAEEEEEILPPPPTKKNIIPRKKLQDVIETIRGDA